MSWRELWPAWLQWPVPAAASIDEELMFHFRSLIDENLSRGMSADAAWRAAQDCFGPLGRYSDECHLVALGVHPMLQKFSTVGLVVLALLVAWLFVEVRSLRQAGAAPPVKAREPLRVAQKPPAGKANGNQDLAGEITDRQGKPLADAQVLVILKTWPNNRYRQQDFAAKTDENGRFRLAKLVPAAGQRAVQLAAVKDGYALTSKYELKKAGEKLDTEAMNLKLDEAAPLTFTIRDAQGRPAPKARLIPLSRKAGNEEHGVYFQAAKAIELVADDKGEVRVGVFRRGDAAEVYVALPGKDWEQHAVAIPEAGDAIEIKTDKAL